MNKQEYINQICSKVGVSPSNLTDQELTILDYSWDLFESLQPEPEEEVSYEDCDHPEKDRSHGSLGPQYIDQFFEKIKIRLLL